VLAKVTNSKIIVAKLVFYRLMSIGNKKTIELWIVQLG
jgi:hypothetical protein